MNNNGLQPYANFSTINDGMAKCERSKCSKLVPVQLLQFIPHQDPRKLGKNLCADCYDYYIQSPSTVYRSPSDDPLGNGHIGDVQAKVNAAQRGEAGASSVRALGQSSHPRANLAAPQNIGVGMFHAPGGPGNAGPLPPAAYRSTSGPRGPNVSQTLLGIQDTSLPPTYNPKRVIIGYDEAHAEFEAFKKHFQSLAFMTLAGEEVVIQGVMYYHAFEKPVHREIPHITETTKGIPAHIGAHALKVVVYHMLLPKYLQWAKGYPLQIEDCELRDGTPSTKYPEITSTNPRFDQDAIADRFYKRKGKNGVLAFVPANAKKATRIALFITEQHFDRVLEHVSQLEANGAVGPPMSLSSSSQVPSIMGPSPGAPKRKPDEQTSPIKESRISQRLKLHQEQSEVSANPEENSPERSSAARLPVVSPKASRLREALQGQIAPARRDLLPFYGRANYMCNIYILPECNLDVIIQNRAIFLDLKNYNHFVSTVSYDKGRSPTYGTFKRSYPSSASSVPLFKSQTTNICLKQAFFRRDAGKTVHIYKGATQGKHLAVELNCLGWGSALLRLVYDFIKQSGVQASFEVPHLHFVEAGLAVCQNMDEDTFLVEEWIDSTQPFVKYINNSSAKPCQFANPDRARIARFLSFCQHVQWIETKGEVFTSDFQGSGELLTDPQIITRPSASLSQEPLFGGGNTNYDRFVKDHSCHGNEFCELWKLPPPIDNKDQVGGEQESSEDNTTGPESVRRLSPSLKFPDPKDLAQSPSAMGSKEMSISAVRKE